MSIFFRRGPEEQRAVTSIAGWGRGDDVMFDSAMKSALAVVPVFAAVRLLTDRITTLPMQGYRSTPGGGHERLPLAPVFPVHGRIRWLQQALMSLLIKGNAFGYQTGMTGTGWPARVQWLNPERMAVDESGAHPIYRYNGVEIPRDMIRHIPAYALPGSVMGLSPIGACAQLTSTGRYSQSMMEDWFKNRAVPGSKFVNSGKTLDMTEAETISDRLSARIRTGKPLVYGNDWSFEAVQLSAADAAFIESAKLTATQVASIYGVPPEKIGGETGSSLTYSTVELNNIDLAQSSLQPWTARLEEEFTSWLPAPRYVKFNLDASIRVETKARYEVHQIARNIGLNNIDEIRALEDLPPLPDGQGQDYTPLGKNNLAVPKETR